MEEAPQQLPTVESREEDSGAISKKRRKNREHTNSRGGCLQCKARKVKCDEEKPNCRACTRRGTLCTYSKEINGVSQLATAASAASSPYQRPDQGFGFIPIQTELQTTSPIVTQTGASFTPIQERSRPTALIYEQNLRTTSPENGDSRASGPSRVRHLSPATPGTSPLVLNLDHLELLFHFVTVTSDAITLGALGQELWKVTVPKLALSHDWLMHSILAISALHIAHLNPDEQQSYWERAAMHQDQALRGQQNALANPSHRNGDALYASTLTTIYLAFASPVTAADLEEMPLTQVVQCLHMLRGISAIASTVKSYIEKGPLSHLSQLHPNHIKNNRTFNDPATETHFLDLLIFASTNADLDGDQDMEDVGTFAAAASSLRASFLKIESVPDGGTPTPAIWHWAVRLPASFVNRVSEKQVVPLVLIAHWCVLLTRLPHFWWIQGWVDRSISEIRGLLPHEHRQQLDWPNDKISEIRAKQANEAV